MERKAIKLPDSIKHSGVYVADTYLHNKPNKTQKYLMPYALDNHEYSCCYFPINSFGRREPKLNLTEKLMNKCVESQVPIILETRTKVPTWALERMRQVRHSVLIIQIPTLSKTMKRRFFRRSDTPGEMQETITEAFQFGLNIRLKFTPIIPSVTKMTELVIYMNSMRAFLKGVDVSFGRFDKEALEWIERRNRLEKGTLMAKYEEVEGEYYLRPEIKEAVMHEFRAFCVGNSIPVREYS